MPGFHERSACLNCKHSCGLTHPSVGARLARDEDNAVYLEPRRLHREQALLPPRFTPTKNLLATIEPAAPGSTQRRNGIHRLTNQRRPLVDKARINLHQARPCGDLLGGVAAFGNPACGDDR